MKKTAIIYDFDKTLCTKDMQEYSLIPQLGYQDASIFWQEVTKLSQEKEMDPISAYLFLLQKQFFLQNNPLRKENFLGIGDQIEFYPGVSNWFERINAYGKQLGLEIEHYVISSGMKEVIEQSSIAKQFRKIYACSYMYDENGIACWPAHIVNYTTKTQYLFRINKQVLEESNEKDLNAFTLPEERPIPFSRMIYIADGITDVPCMKLVKEYGGKSIVVYNPDSAKAGITAEQILRDGRANYISVANYEEGQSMEKILHLILDHIHVEEELLEIEGKLP